MGVLPEVVLKTDREPHRHDGFATICCFPGPWRTRCHGNHGHPTKLPGRRPLIGYPRAESGATVADLFSCRRPAVSSPTTFNRLLCKTRADGTR
jgi:hypothetical protein